MNKHIRRSDKSSVRIVFILVAQIVTTFLKTTWICQHAPGSPIYLTSLHIKPNQFGSVRRTFFKLEVVGRIEEVLVTSARVALSSFSQSFNPWQLQKANFPQKRSPRQAINIKCSFQDFQFSAGFLSNLEDLSSDVNHSSTMLSVLRQDSC